MRQEDEPKHVLLRRAGLGFAYLCFAVAAVAIGTALYLLPLTWRVRLFLALAGLVVATLFAFMAILTHRVLRLPDGGRRPSETAPDRKPD